MTPIHVHLFHFAALPADALLFLDEDEEKRYDRLVFEPAKRQFLAGRYVLKNLLSNYLGCAPTDIHFTYSLDGKPFLPEAPLHFNLSHSYDRFACAVDRQAPVGVDIEKIRPVEVAPFSYYFHPDDVALFAALAQTNPDQASFELIRRWTLKEAFLKACDSTLPPEKLLCIRQEEESWMMRGENDTLFPEWRLDWQTWEDAWSLAVAYQGEEKREVVLVSGY